jgi:hypothetical protein
MMMKCPECKCRFREEEGKEDEYESEEMEEEGGEEKSVDDEMEMPEGELMVEKVELPASKEKLIKKRLMELGKMIASLK